MEAFEHDASACFRALPQCSSHRKDNIDESNNKKGYDTIHIASRSRREKIEQELRWRTKRLVPTRFSAEVVFLALRQLQTHNASVGYYLRNGLPLTDVSINYTGVLSRFLTYCLWTVEQ